MGSEVLKCCNWHGWVPWFIENATYALVNSTVFFSFCFRFFLTVDLIRRFLLTKKLRSHIVTLYIPFNEVNTPIMMAGEERKKMISLFGGEVKRLFSNNTTYLLTYKSTNVSKTKSANERQMEEVNLWRLQNCCLVNWRSK